jgi:hypothetical protein
MCWYGMIDSSKGKAVVAGVTRRSAPRGGGEAFSPGERGRLAWWREQPVGVRIWRLF